nr:hypothetical protein [uncultured Psychroserpens sp.]
MKKIYLLISLIVFSCSTKEETKLNILFEDNLNINNVLNQEIYKKLNKDQEYKEFINDLYDFFYDFFSNGFTATEFLADRAFSEASGSNNTTFDEIGSGAKLIGSGMWDILSNYDVALKKEKLYASFSSEKLSLAKNLENNLTIILSDSLKKTNKEVKIKTSEGFINYKSFGPTIKSDDNLYDHLDDLTDEVDELGLLAFNIRVMQNLNILSHKKIDNFDEFCKISKSLLYNEISFNITTNSDMLDDYLELIHSISKKIESTPSNFSVPIEDWSKEKIKNYKFIMEDIIASINNDILSLNQKEKSSIFENVNYKKIGENDVDEKNLEIIENKINDLTEIDTKTKPKNITGYINGTNVIMRKEHSTQSKIIGSFKISGEKVAILDEYYSNNNEETLIDREIIVKTNIGTNYNLQKGKSVSILSRQNGNVKIQFKDKELRNLTTSINESHLAKTANSKWYQVKRNNGEIGWVFGKFINF